MNHYELMVIFSPLLSEESYKDITEKYVLFLQEHKAPVQYKKAWGLKSLAYPIQKKTTGFYWILEYQADSSFNQKLRMQLSRDENVIRYLLTSLDKYAIAYNEKKRKANVPLSEQDVPNA